MKRIFRNFSLPVISVTVFVTVILLVIAPTLVRIRAVPPGVTYYLGAGFLPDYYQYLSWIRSGMAGMTFLTTRLDILPQTPALIHPFFLMLGWIARVVGLSAPDTLFIARIMATAVFLLSVFALIDRVFNDTGNRTVARILFFSWSYVWTKTQAGFIQPIAWSTNFDVVGKFALSPHHLLAISAAIATILALHPKTGKPKFAPLVLFPLLTGLLNPSILLVLMLVCGMEILFWSMGMLHSVREKPVTITRHIRSLPLPVVIVVAAMIPVLIYNEYLFRMVHPWNLMYGMMKAFRPPVSFTDYVMALGPWTVLAVMGLLSPSVWKNGFLRSCVVWGFAPIMMFPLVGTVLPINESRLFQLYQYIPLSICAAAGVTVIASGIAKFRLFSEKSWTKTAIQLGIALAALAYVFPPMTAAVASGIAVNPNEYSNYLLYATPDAAAAYTYLDRTGDDSPVIAGEYVSQLVAALTPHRVFLGRDDNVVGYYKRRQLIFDFVNGKMTREEVIHIRNTLHPRYVLSGIDTYPLENLPYVKWGGLLVEVFRSGNVSVWKFADVGSDEK